MAEYPLCSFMEWDRAFAPEEIGLCGAKGIVFAANGVAHLVEEFGRLFAGIGDCHVGKIPL